MSLGMESLSTYSLPPGFGFHPTDEEIISHYLKKKILGQKVDAKLIPVVEIYKHEPWDLPEKCPIPTRDCKWHFFALRDRKYSNGFRSNRATAAGYWKSTGKDRNIKSHNHIVGTKKTLVFHEGRPPSGKRTEWIMHEYYLDECECKAALESKDIFVLCRVTKRDGWASQGGQAYNGQEETVQIGKANEPEDAPDLVVDHEPFDPSNDINDIDAWIDAALCPDSILESFPELNDAAQILQEDLCSFVQKQAPVDTQFALGEADDFDFLFKEDIDSILQFDSNNFSPYCFEEAPTGNFLNEFENDPSSMLSSANNDFTSDELSETGIVIRPNFRLNHSDPASGAQFQQIWNQPCKLKISRNHEPMKATLKFSKEIVLVNGHKSDINLKPLKKAELVHHKSSSYCNTSSSDVESDSGSEINNSLDASGISQEGVSTKHCHHQGGTRKAPNKLVCLFSSAGPKYLYISILVVVLAAFVYILLRKTSSVASSSQFLDF